MRLTFNIEDSIAKKFLSSIPDRQRSKIVSSLIRQVLEQKKKSIIEACLKANKDNTLNRDINEWQSFETPIDGEWS